eukprot:6202415-Pleurochrysis_carterae.AAC.3
MFTFNACKIIVPRALRSDCFVIRYVYPTAHRQADRRIHTISSSLMLTQVSIKQFNFDERLRGRASTAVHAGPDYKKITDK